MVVGGWLRPILVFSLSLDQAEQNIIIYILQKQMKFGLDRANGYPKFLQIPVSTFLNPIEFT